MTVKINTQACTAHQIHSDILVYCEILEQVNQFTYLGCNISYQASNDMESKLAKFLQLIGTIKRTTFRKSENRNYFENIQHFNFTYIFIWVRKLDFDSLTETKN